MSKQRDITLDGLKFLMICLVVIGHVIEPTRYTTLASGMLYSAIYAFHMPMFVLLSGYFSKQQDLAKINNQAIKLLETFLVMDLTIGLLLGRQLIPILLKPSASCWYLLSLIYWRYMLYWMVKVMKIGKMILMSSSIAIAVAFLLMPIPSDYSGIFSVMRTAEFFPFFILGYCIDKEFVEKLRERISVSIILCLLSLIMLAFTCLFTEKSFHNLEYHRDTLYSLNTKYGWAWTDSILYLSAITIAGLTVSLALLSVRRLPKIFCEYGRHTLVFYFVQGIMTFKLAEVLPKNLAIELLLAVGTIVVGGVISNYCPRITNPVSWFLESVKQSK